jgi:hypothetical protein
VVAVRQHRPDELLRITQAAELGGTLDRVAVRVALVVEVVEEAGGTPRLELRTVHFEPVAGVPAHGRFDRESVLAERLAACPLAEQRPGVGAGRCGHGAARVARWWPRGA